MVTEDPQQLFEGNRIYRGGHRRPAALCQVALMWDVGKLLACRMLGEELSGAVKL